MSNKIGRNDPCPCGSAEKYKKCCLPKGINYTKHPNVDTKPNSSSILKHFQKYQNIDLVASLSALSIYPPNHSKNLRLDYLILEAFKSNKLNREIITVEELEKITNEYLPFHPLEDPPSTLFTENVTSTLGNNIVYTGNYEQGVFTLNTILTAIHFNIERFSKDFKEKTNSAFLLLLAISNTIAERIGHVRNLEGVDQSDDAQIKFPANLDTYKGAILFTMEWLNTFCENMGIDSRTIDFFTLSGNDIKNSTNIIGESHNPLVIKPLCKISDGFVVVAPTCIVSSLIHFVWVQAEFYGCKTELINNFHRNVLNEIFSSRLKIGLNPENTDLITDHNIPIKTALFRIDADKLLLLSFYYDEGEGYSLESPRHLDPMTKFGEQKGIHKQNILLLQENFPDDKILDLSLYSSIGRAYMQIWPYTQNALCLTTTAYDFLCWIKSDSYEILDLWYYLDAKKRLELKVKCSPLDFLNTFYFYNTHNNSFYLGDTQLPDHFSLLPGGELEIIRKAILNEDRILVYHQLNDPFPVLIPVVRDDSYIPRYFNLDIWRDQLEFYIPGFEVDIWLRAKKGRSDIAKEEAPLYWELSETISFWLGQVRDFLNEHLKQLNLFSITICYEIDDFVKFNASENFGIKQGNVSEKFTLQVEKNKISITIPFEIIGHFSSEDNEGERILLRKFLESFGLLLEFNNLKNTLEHDRIANIIEEKAPFGLKRMLFAINSENSIALDSRNVIKPRFLKESRVQWVNDIIVTQLESKCPPIGEITDKEVKMQLAKNVVNVLLEKLRYELKDYNSIEILKQLMANNEAIIHENESTRLRTPTRKVCFAEQENIVNEMDEKARLVDATSLACRCLIEHLAIEPTFGNKVVSNQIIDDLMALMSSIIGWGGLGDRINFSLFDVKMAILPSGRIGTNSIEITKLFFDGFSEARAKKYIEDSLEYFPTFFSNNVTEESLLSQNFQDSFTNEVGLSFEKLTQIIFLLIQLGFKQDDIVSSLPITELKSIIKKNFQDEITEAEIESSIKFLKIWNWGDVKKPPTGFSSIDIYPWRYNRKLSYLQRPLIFVDYNDNKDSPIIFWTPRHLEQSLNYIYHLLVSGRYRAKQKSELERQMTKISKKRSSVLQKAVVGWLESNCDCFLIDEEVSISPKGKLKHTTNIGDIDIFAIDVKNQILLSIECKRTEPARNTKEMVEQVEQYYGRGSEKGYFKKHIERHNWLKANSEELKKVYKIDFGSYRIASVFITYDVLAIQYMEDKPLPIPLFSLTDINNFNYEEWLDRLLDFYYQAEQKRNIQLDAIIAKKLTHDTEEIQFLKSIKQNRIGGKSGELQINLTWNSKDDLDLHVETPVDEIYYKNKRIEYDNVIGE